MLTMAQMLFDVGDRQLLHKHQHLFAGCNSPAHMLLLLSCATSCTRRVLHACL